MTDRYDVSSRDSSFAHEAAGPAAPNPTPLKIPRRAPGPGIWESIIWTVGLPVVQAAAIAGAMCVLAIAFLATIEAGDLEKNMRDVAGLSTLMTHGWAFIFENLVFLAAFAQLATLGYALAAIRLRNGRQGVWRLGWQRPAAGHWLLVVLMVFPLQLLCGKLHLELGGLMPGSAKEYAEQLRAMARAPLPALVLVIAVGPALAEELLFRGLIGRGLVARWGFVRGILLTSFLFGMVHLNPGQAIAVIPMGIAMHFVYLATRSFWAPVTLHFLNNALAAVALKLDTDVTVAMLPAHVVTASAAMITAIGLLLWQTRVQYRLRDGSIWGPGYASAELPPPDIEAVPIRQVAPRLLLAGGTINSLGFLAILWRLAAGT